jgi:hypothetical protein
MAFRSTRWGSEVRVLCRPLLTLLSTKICDDGIADYSAGALLPGRVVSGVALALERLTDRQFVTSRDPRSPASFRQCMP